MCCILNSALVIDSKKWHHQVRQLFPLSSSYFLYLISQTITTITSICNATERNEQKNLATAHRIKIYVLNFEFSFICNNSHFFIISLYFPSKIYEHVYQLRISLEFIFSIFFVLILLLKFICVLILGIWFGDLEKFVEMIDTILRYH